MLGVLRISMLWKPQKRQGPCVDFMKLKGSRAAAADALQASMPRVLYAACSWLREIQLT